MQTVSSTYLDALRDEREILRRAIADGEDLATLSRDVLANAEATLARGWSGPMLDAMRAGRDFWRLQVKKYPA
jgi:hypothetical protein